MWLYRRYVCVNTGCYSSTSEFTYIDELVLVADKQVVQDTSLMEIAKSDLDMITNNHKYISNSS